MAMAVIRIPIGECKYFGTEKRRRMLPFESLLTRLRRFIRHRESGRRHLHRQHGRVEQLEDRALLAAITHPADPFNIWLTGDTGIGSKVEYSGWAGGTTETQFHFAAMDGQQISVELVPEEANVAVDFAATLRWNSENDGIGGRDARAGTFVTVADGDAGSVQLGGSWEWSGSNSSANSTFQYTYPYEASGGTWRAFAPEREVTSLWCNAAFESSFGGCSSADGAVAGFEGGPALSTNYAMTAPLSAYSPVAGGIGNPADTWTLIEFEQDVELISPSGRRVDTSTIRGGLGYSESAGLGFTADETGLWYVSLKPGQGVAPIEMTLERSAADILLDYDPTPHDPSAGFQFGLKSGADLTLAGTASNFTINGQQVLGVSDKQFGAESITDFINVHGDDGDNIIDSVSLTQSITVNSGGGEDAFIAAPVAGHVFNGGDDRDTFKVAADFDFSVDSTWVESPDIFDDASDFVVTMTDIEHVEVHGGESDNTLEVIDDSNPDLDVSFFGHGGSDFIFGGAGNDLLDGGEGNDDLSGGLGGDELLGGPGNDFIIPNGGFSPGDGKLERADGGEGHDTIEWHPGDAFELLTGGIDADNNDIDTLRIEGNALQLDITGSQPDGGAPQLAIDRDGTQIDATGFERLQGFLQSFTRPPEVAAPEQTVNIITPIGISNLLLNTDEGKDVIRVEAPDTAAGNSFVDVSTGDGADEITFVAPAAVGAALSVDLNGEDGDDTFGIFAAADGVGPINVEVSGGYGTDAVTISGTDAADRIFITQLATLPNGNTAQWRHNCPRRLHARS